MDLRKHGQTWEQVAKTLNHSGEKNTDGNPFTVQCVQQRYYNNIRNLQTALHQRVRNIRHNLRGVRQLLRVEGVDPGLLTSEDRELMAKLEKTGLLFP